MYCSTSSIARNTVYRRSLFQSFIRLRFIPSSSSGSLVELTRLQNSTRAMSSDSKPSSATDASSSKLVDKSPKVTFSLSPVPPNPLGNGRCIRQAAALIIGDEILNGKTLDRNSHGFAQFCFENGIDLKRIEVVPDIEEEIVEAARRLVKKYDLVITSGGIGPTHDDITYQSLAKAFDQKLEHHEETIRRLTEMSKHRSWVGRQNKQQRAATLRMALFPHKAEVLFVGEDIWVPVVRLEGKLCVFPGIPGLFTKMLRGLTPFLPLPPKNERPMRIQIFTERAESMIAPYLTALQERLKPHGIQVGSYPILYKGVFVSLIGRDIGETSTLSGEDLHKPKVWLAEIAQEVEKEIAGKIVSDEDVRAKKSEGNSGSAPGDSAKANM
ncbi:MoaB/Mog domain-containing protein [Crepidotus variabilis]|uniref:MoaB/Mog domain-containing protein n=1 Tax=Crepidotus variabilis TaxID=179855 RepID=A0A9P6JN04_9AGAR|nr:MoaB/Mog domain-containing protein [Crepidotus variabilis]